jgi:hypothetical protein
MDDVVSEGEEMGQISWAKNSFNAGIVAFAESKVFRPRVYRPINDNAWSCIFK